MDRIKIVSLPVSAATLRRREARNAGPTFGFGSHIIYRKNVHRSERLINAIYEYIMKRVPMFSLEIYKKDEYSQSDDFASSYILNYCYIHNDIDDNKLDTRCIQYTYPIYRKFYIHLRSKNHDQLHNTLTRYIFIGKE